MKNILPILAIIAAVAIAGCTGQEGPTDNPPLQPESGNEQPAAGGQPGLKVIEMVIFHTGYSTSTINVNKGDTVRILARTGPGTENHAHGITIDEFGVNQRVTSPAEPVTIEFVADKAGTFRGYCGTCKDGIFGAGHPEMAMQLVVE